jgi:hypothetical protein
LCKDQQRNDAGDVAGGFEDVPGCGFLAARRAGKEAPRLPDFKLEIPVFANQFEAGAVGCDEACAVRAGGESDQDIEVEFAELARLEALVSVDFRQEPAGFQPVLFCRREKGLALFKGEDYLPIDGR